MLSLIAAVVTAATLTVPVMFPLAAAVIAGHRRWAWTAGVAGGGIVLGLLATLPYVLLGAALTPGTVLGVGSALAHLLGLLGAIGCGVLLIRRPTGMVVGLHGPAGPIRQQPGHDGTAGDPPRLPGTDPAADSSAVLVLAIATGALLGFGEPLQSVPALFDLTSSPAVVIVAALVGAVVLAAGATVLVLLGRKFRPAEIGIGVATLVAAVMLLPGLAGALLATVAGAFSLGIPAWLSMLAVPAAFVIATAATALVGTRRPLPDPSATMR